MEYKSNKMIQTINDIIKYLKICDYPTAEYYCRFFICTLEQLNRPHELHKVAENILKVYGGMGSFNDVVIFANGEYLTEKNREFDKLTGELFSQCEEAVAGTSFMKYKSNEMAMIINEIIKLLKMCDHKDAEYYCDFFTHTLDQLNKPHELYKIAENVLKIYDGIKSFNDVIIFNNGELLKEECDELDDFRSILYSQCKQAIAAEKK